MIALLINGRAPADPAAAIAADDRGFNYGDGLFESMLYRDGRVRLLDAHLQRLASGCVRLGITVPDEPQLREEVGQICSAATDGVVKIVVTRGAGGRGYRPPADLSPTRVVSLNALPPAVRSVAELRWCEIRLGRNPALAGMKHLNRLEQVLAQREWNDPAIDEGLLLDSEGELVSATMSNVFIVRNESLVTPDLRFCGVRGVMRGEVLRVAREIGIDSSEQALWPGDVDGATEVFITNAVRGVRSVIGIGAKRWEPGPVTHAIAAAVSAR